MRHCLQYCSIVPREVVEKHGRDFRNHPCGTGPFQFKSWEEGQALILLKNDDYFVFDSTGTRLPYLDAIKTTFYDSKATEFLLFQQGRLDFINDIDASFKDEVLTKRGELRNEWKGKIMLYKHPYLNTEYLGMLIDSTNELVRNSPVSSSCLCHFEKPRCYEKKHRCVNGMYISTCRRIHPIFLQAREQC